MNFYQFADPIGIFGVILVLIAYYLLTVGKMNALDLSYQLLNLFGSAFILFSLIYTWNLSAVMIESAWIVVSFIGIYRSIKNTETLA